jgi:D-alanyl-D-alanine carboxypeptidase/D-alanyl-D-alanine-endopeptidase (penicillin-binding protein 4)
VVVDKGSGLSRETRITASQLATLLLQAWRSPVMPELMSSLPVSGVDGTLKRSTATGGRAHLKTGSLRDVAAQAGYVLSRSGRRYVLVALVNDAQAGRARPALEALTQWVMDDAPGPEQGAPASPDAQNGLLVARVMARLPRVEWAM